MCYVWKLVSKMCYLLFNIASNVARFGTIYISSPFANCLCNILYMYISICIFCQCDNIFFLNQALVKKKAFMHVLNSNASPPYYRKICEKLLSKTNFHFRKIFQNKFLALVNYILLSIIII